jgi:DNA-directed RNA polymerase subunit RPC12/RpoP
MATNTPNFVVGISDNPTLVFIPVTSKHARTESSLCCDAKIYFNGDCSSCEMKAPAPTDYHCSVCEKSVHASGSEGLRLECGDCGARWDDFDMEFIVDISTGALHGIRANGWNPAKAPERITTYLQSFAGLRSAA